MGLGVIMRRVPNYVNHSLRLTFTQDLETSRRMSEINVWCLERGGTIEFSDSYTQEIAENHRLVREATDPNVLKTLRDTLKCYTKVGFSSSDLMFEFKMRWL